MYNSCMIILESVLTVFQRDLLAMVLDQVVKNGHGEITIRVVKGQVRFIKTSYERPFYPSELDNQDNQQ